MNASVSRQSVCDQPETENVPRANSRARKTMDIVRSNLESLKFELSHGSGVDPQKLREMEERIKVLEDRSGQ
jgi:hypothetical protein